MHLGISTAQVSTGEVAPFGQPRMYCGTAPSPDGRYVMVAWLERPFSYEVPCGRFPRRTQLWDRCADITCAGISAEEQGCTLVCLCVRTFIQR